MKFAHLADCHIGGWREESLKALGIKSFERIMDICIKEHVGFILIAGDLFNTAIPSIDLLRETAALLRRVRDHDIDVYIIPGSHDFSYSGKTMLDVLEEAGLVHNVMRFDDDGKLVFTTDKTGVKLTGLLGKKGGLERLDYERLSREHLEKEAGFKIFLFHTLINEFRPPELEMVDSTSVATLPKNFHYYAGGHPHFVFKTSFSDGLLSYPGPSFPNNFKELEELGCGGFYIVDDKLNILHIPIRLKEVVSYVFDAADKTPDAIERDVISTVKDVTDRIVTLRFEGVLSSGKPSDINFRNIFSNLSSAYCVLKNTHKLTSKEFIEEETIASEQILEIESSVVRDNKSPVDISSFGISNIESFVSSLMVCLNTEKQDGEKNADFEKRVVRNVSSLFSLQENL